MTDILAQDISPLLLAGIIAAAAWFLRMQANWRSVKRSRQLAYAAEMLNLHAKALAQFLDDPASPTELKRALIQMSDAMTEREFVSRIIEWVSCRAFDQPAEPEGAQATLEAELSPLRRERPDLVESFDMALLTAVAGGCLRWPETASHFETVFPRLAVAPRRDAAIAATAAGFRLKVPFSMKSSAPAMA